MPDTLTALLGGIHNGMWLRLEVGDIGQAGDGEQDEDDAEDGSAYLHYEFPVGACYLIAT